MPKFLGLMHADADSEAEAPPDPELISKMGAFVEEAVNAGVLLATDGLKASRYGKRLIAEDGEIRVVDGPFTESKELIASYALMQCKEMDEVVEWTKRFLAILGKGTVDIRPILEFDDFPAEIMPPEEVTREAVFREQMQRNFEQAR